MYLQVRCLITMSLSYWFLLVGEITISPTLILSPVSASYTDSSDHFFHFWRDHHRPCPSIWPTWDRYTALSSWHHMQTLTTVISALNPNRALLFSDCRRSRDCWRYCYSLFRLQTVFARLLTILLTPLPALGICRPDRAGFCHCASDNIHFTQSSLPVALQLQRFVFTWSWS